MLVDTTGPVWVVVTPTAEVLGLYIDRNLAEQRAAETPDSSIKESYFYG